jgi:hypothetical protein
MRLTGHSLGYGGVAYGAVAVYGVVGAASGLTPVGGYPARRKYVVRRDGQLLVFSSRQAAHAALEEIEDAQEVPAPRKAKPKKVAKAAKQHAAAKEKEAPEISVTLAALPEIAPLEIINVEYIRALAFARGQIEAAERMLAQARYRALLDLVAQLQDEEDVEMLLMAVH